MANFVRFFMVALVAIVCSFGFSNNAEAEINISEVSSLDLPNNYVVAVATTQNTAFLSSVPGSLPWGGNDGHEGHLYMIDVSDPTEPRLLETHNDLAGTGIETRGDYIFTTFFEGDAGLKIFFIDSLIYSGGPANVTGMLLDDHLLYVTSRVDSANFLYILDISNPYQPETVGELDIGHIGTPRALIEGRLYVGGWQGVWERSLRSLVSIIDVANPEEPEVLRQFEQSGIITTLATNGEVFFISINGGANYGLQVRNLNWELVSHYESSLPVDLKLHQGFLFSASIVNGSNIIEVFDVSNPERLEIVAEYTTGRRSQALWFDGELCYVAEDGSNDLPSRLLILHLDIEEEAVSEPLTQPFELKLKEAYPNPFNSSTRIGFTLPQAGKTLMAVYDLSGREIARLVDAQVPAGAHNVVFDAEGLATGMYILRLETPAGIKSQKLMLVK